MESQHKSCLKRTKEREYRVQFLPDTLVYLLPPLGEFPKEIIVEIVRLPSWRPSHSGQPKPVAHARKMATGHTPAREHTHVYTPAREHTPARICSCPGNRRSSHVCN